MRLLWNRIWTIAGLGWLGCFLFPLSLTAQDFQNELTKVVTDPALKYAGFSICVMDTKNGEVVASYNPDLCLMPASSLKLVTTAAALGILGSDYTFHTELQYDGSIDSDGVLNGNLFIKGFGDPTLGSDQFKGAEKMEVVLQKFVTAVKDKGIRKIRGMVVGDASWFDNSIAPPTWQWNDLGNQYATGAWGLNFHENMYYAELQQARKPGMHPKLVGTNPYVPELELINNIVTGNPGSGDDSYVLGGPYAETRLMEGRIPPGRGRIFARGSLPDPAYFAAWHLENRLEKAGINVFQDATTQFEFARKGLGDEKRLTILVYQSAPLASIINETNLKSVNLYAESLLKTIGKTRRGVGGTLSGLNAVRDYWRSKGVNLEGFYMEDGCGLSPRNAVSTKHLASILYAASRDTSIFNSLWTSLPTAALTGTLQGMFRKTDAVGKIHAKTGTMSRVRSFTGYVQTKSGKILSFSVIANNYTCTGNVLRRMLTPLMVSMVNL